MTTSFKMIRGEDMNIGTTDKDQSSKIKDAMISQAQAMVQARKDAKAAASQQAADDAEEEKVPTAPPLPLPHPAFACFCLL
jgi:hypothetical protein